jgi:hypothetical protein
LSKRSRKKGGRRPNIPQVTLERFGAEGETTAVSGLRRGGEFVPDYSHVVSDLKRIGVLAGFFIALLIALSFILG